MSRGATLSVLGLYKSDSGLFSEMVYPSGFTADEKQTTVGNILAECAELECLFPDANTMKTMIGLWSKLNISVWERIFTASQLEYNPIENYNRTELETISDDRTDTHSGNDINKLSGTDTETTSATNTQTNTGTDTHTTSETHSGTDTHTISETNSGTDTTTNSITAYDANTLLTHDNSALQHGLSKSGSDALAYGHAVAGSDALLHGHTIADNGSGSSSTSYGKTETLTHGEKIVHEGDITRNNHTSGNIGVTTSQQMLEQEIEVSAKLNVIKMIVESFKERFCLLVY